MLEHLTNSYNAGIDELEAKGYLASKSYYEALQNAEGQKIAVLEKELADLTTAFSQATASGEIAKYSPEWYEFQSSINGVKEELQDANVAMLEFAKSAREVEWEHFDYLQERISLLTDEANFYIDLMSNSRLHNDDGSLTNEGMATAGMHGQNYNVLMAQADMYADEAKKIQSEMAADPYNTDLIARRDELLKLQREAILAAEDEKQAIADLVREGYEKELESMQNLISSYKDALDQAKDLYDYQKKVADHTSEISSLQKQITAYEGDDSEETRAKLQQLRVKLQEEQENLQETEYDKYISDQKALLDDLYLQAEQTFTMRMDDIDAVVSDMISSINADADVINSTLIQVGNDVGYTMTSEMQSIWSSATDSINGVLSMYGDNFLSGQTSVIAAINTIGTYVQSLISAANQAAQQRIEQTKAETQADPNVQPLAPTVKEEPPKVNNTPAPSTNDGGVKVGGKINAGNAKIYDYIGTAPETQIFKNDPIYTVLKEQNGWIQVRYHKLSSGVTGWFKKSDVKAYKTGGIVDETGMAWLDGTKQNPEMVLNARDTQNFLELNDHLRALSNQGLSMRGSALGYTSGGMAISHGSGVDFASLASRIHENGSTFGDAKPMNVTFGDIVIPIDHVNDYNDFVTQLQKDRQFEKMVQSVTVDRLAGKSSLAKNKFNWNR